MTARGAAERWLKGATEAYRQGDPGRAVAACHRALEAQADCAPALTLLGVIAAEHGDLERACALLTRVSQLASRSAAAHFTLGKALRDAGRVQEALASYEEAIRLEPGFAEAHYNRGNLLSDAGRMLEACEAFSCAAAARPGFAAALANLGRAHHVLGQHAVAAARCREALAVDRNHGVAWVTLGNALQALGDAEGALEAYDNGLRADPRLAEAHYNRGQILAAQGDTAQALASLQEAVRANPRLAEAHHELGHLLHAQGRQPEALESYRAAIRARPEYREAALAIGRLLRFLNRDAEALAVFEKARAIDPNDVEALRGKAAALMGLHRYPEAKLAYEQLRREAPDTPFVEGLLLHAKMLCCDWEGLAALYRAVRDGIEAGRASAEPFGLQGIAQTPAELQACARRYAQVYFPPRARPTVTGTGQDGRVGIGYLSGEFRHQATSILLTEVLELHDKSRFKVVCFDNGFDDGSELRRRIVAAADEIVDISAVGDEQAANAVSARGINILVNLNGYFGRGRQEVFAMRSAPIQVNYLGFPGTLGADYMDYIIADPVVLPAHDRVYYDEKVVWLPDCYQANDRQRAIGPRVFTRAELGLPDTGFVFCCFNNTYKILPDVFDVWMRLLARIPGSVLWLYEASEVATANLRREASSRGVDPGRLVFGEKMRLADHLARLQLADLCLDTLPYNAHTTGSDALWAGLPVLTCAGSTFPARVGASMLQAVGLPELITENLPDYESLALSLALDPDRLAAIREKLACNRLSAPLFDSARFTHHLEDAYAAMMDRHRSGLSPDHIAVTARPPSQSRPA